MIKVEKYVTSFLKRKWCHICDGEGGSWSWRSDMSILLELFIDALSNRILRDIRIEARDKFRTRGSKTLDCKFSLKLLSKYSFLTTIQHYTSRSTIYYLP